MSADDLIIIKYEYRYWDICWYSDRKIRVP